MEIITLKEGNQHQTLKWYIIDQNNSGGYMINNENVTDYIGVQAYSIEDAKRHLYDIVENYSQYCECCGERWSVWYLSENDATDVPMINNKPLHELEREFFRNEIILYYHDGRKELIKFKTKSS